MKNVAMYLWILAVSCLLLPNAAMADNYVEKAGGKFVNGAANAAGALLEIPKNIKIGSREKGPLYGMTAGVVAGVPAYYRTHGLWSSGHGNVHDSHHRHG
jgi:hypothetical protein